MESKKAVLYYRVSTDEQNCENQQSDLKRYCQFRNWSIAAEYKDEGISSRITRPEMEKMMNEIRRGTYNVLLVWSYDRFARNVAHLMMTLDELKNLGVDFASYRQQLDTTSPMGHMMFTVFAGFAQLERDMVSERTKAALARLKAQGKRLGPPITSPKVIAAAIEMRKEGLSMRKIAEASNMSLGWVHRILKSYQNGYTPTQIPRDS
jgi:DNA invertase Pin-like site-specific DNA recombinase